MQMLETIQEYVPFKHSFGYFSSWIVSRYGESGKASQEAAQSSPEEGAVGVSDAEGQSEDPGNDKPEGNDHDAHLSGAGNQESLVCETSFTEDGPSPAESHPELPHSSKDSLPNGTISEEFDTHGTDGSNRDSVGSKIESFLYNNIPTDYCSCASDSENDKSDKRPYTNDKKHVGSHSLSKKLPMFLKRRRKKKRRGSTWSDYRPSLARIHCACAMGGDELCLVHLKSQSESDISASRQRRIEDYSVNGYLSDISVTSFSLAEDDSSSGSYVDIDLRHIPKSLLDSGSWSRSDRSLELSSGWSEIHRTISDPSLGEDCVSLAEECRESDIPDTASDFSQDSRSHVPRVRPQHARSRMKRMPFGHNVNESFVENECFCCHCIVM